jgi:hypothetical protein
MYDRDALDSAFGGNLGYLSRSAIAIILRAHLSMHLSHQTHVRIQLAQSPEAGAAIGSSTCIANLPRPR